MDTVNNVLNNFNSIVDYMSLCINNKFIKVQKACRNLDPERTYYVQLVDKSGTCVVGFYLVYIKENTWAATFLYEDSCCCNQLPCDNYKDSITGMTTAEVANLFSKPRFALIVDITDGYEIITKVRL